MAKFRDSTLHESILHPGSASSHQQQPPGLGWSLQDRTIGDIIREKRGLNVEHIEKILSHQRTHNIRFGEAAIALGYASSEDVMSALAEQFHYPYASRGNETLSDELVTLKQPFSLQSEAFRATRSQIMMRLFSRGDVHRVLAIISPNRGDGKTYFSANLAITLAQLGGRTLLVDADLREPRQHELFSLRHGSGLSGILSGRNEAQVIQQVPEVPSLFVLPVGVVPPNPSELVERPAFGLLMRELSSKFDHVIVDTPAAAHGADCSVIAARCGAALVLARKNASQVTQLQALVNGLTDTPAKLAGVVLNEF
jgi:protein-tyrosine kinase